MEQKPLIKTGTAWSALITAIAKLVADYYQMPELADAIVAVGGAITVMFLRKGMVK